MLLYCAGRNAYFSILSLKAHFQRIMLAYYSAIIKVPMKYSIWALLNIF